MKNDSQHAQVFALLTVCELVRQFALSGWDSPGARSITYGRRMKKAGSKGMLARWFLCYFGDRF